MPISETMPFRHWCRAKGFSVSTGYEIKKSGMGPELLEVPGVRGARVTPEADAAWEQRMAELAKSEAAALEAARRREIAVIAGKIAAQSPKHISRRKQAPKHKHRGRE